MQPRSKYHDSTSVDDGNWEIWTGCTLKCHTVVPHYNYDIAMEQFKQFETLLNRFIEENRPALWDRLEVHDNYGSIGGGNVG